MVLSLRACVAAVLRKDLGQEPEQENSYQDRHVRNEHRIFHRDPGPFNRENLAD